MNSLLPALQMCTCPGSFGRHLKSHYFPAGLPFPLLRLPSCVSYLTIVHVYKLYYLFIYLFIGTLALDGLVVTAKRAVGRWPPNPVPSQLYQTQIPTHQTIKITVYQLHTLR